MKVLAGVKVDGLEGDGELDRDFLAGNAVFVEEANRLLFHFVDATVTATGDEAGEGVERGADDFGQVRFRGDEGDEDDRQVFHGTVLI